MLSVSDVRGPFSPPSKKMTGPSAPLAQQPDALRMRRAISAVGAVGYQLSSGPERNWIMNVSPSSTPTGFAVISVSSVTPPRTETRHSAAGMV